MAVKVFKPVTPGQRGMTTQDFDQITASKPIKSLLQTKTRSSGRNNRGVITCRRRGGGTKRHLRTVNWCLPDGFSAKVEAIEYDPNRSARLARVKQAAGDYHYLLAPQNLKVGDQIQAGEQVPIELGNCLPLDKIPVGTIVYCIELIPGKGAQLVRSAGVGAQLAAKDNGYAQLKLPSGEVRAVNLKARAQIGSVGNEQHQNVKLGKAGRSRYLGRRPKVRGVAMNANDHPHGGGEAKGKGYKHPQSPWGQHTLGYKTRSRRKDNKFIVRSRHLSKKRRK